MVKAWRETVVIPTYEVGTPEKNPIFLENEFIKVRAEWFILILSSRVSAMKRWIRSGTPSGLRMNTSR